MKLNIYCISTKNRLNIKTAFLRESTSPFGKDTIREYRSQVHRLSLSPTPFIDIKFTRKPFTSAHNYGLKLNVNLFIHILLRYITYNFPKLGISPHWTQYWPLTNWQRAWAEPHRGNWKHRVLPAAFARGASSHRSYMATPTNLAGKGTQHVFWTPSFPARL